MRNRSSTWPGKPRRVAVLCLGLAALGGCVATVGSIGPHVRQEITARMQSTQGALSQCYEDALKRDRTLHGDVVLNFEVDPFGQFMNVGVTGPVGDAGMRQCLIAQTSALRLSQPPGSRLAITYHLRLTPRDNVTGGF